MPDVFDAIHARQQPDVFDRIHASQPDRFDQIRTQLEADAAKPWYEKAIEGAKSLGSMVAAPIIGIPSAIGQVGGFIADPGSVARRTLNPETAGGLPGAASSNPLAEAIGSGEAALLVAREEGPNASIHRREIGRLEQAAPATTAPETAPPEQSSGVVGNIRQAWNLYKKVRKLSPTKLGEAGFEKFLDYVEGETPKPAAPAPPLPPEARPSPEMMRHASVPLTAEEQALAQHVMAGVEPQPPAAPASVQTPTPAGGLTDPAYTPEPMQPGISLPAQPGKIAPPEAAAPTTPKRAPSGDAQSLTSKLLEWKMTPDEVQAMNEKGWIKLAYQAGVPLPSKAMRETAIVNLKHSLAGPALSVSELMQRFRTTPAAGTGGEAAATLAANPKAMAAAQALSDALNETNVGEMMKRTRRPRK